MSSPELRCIPQRRSLLCLCSMPRSRLDIFMIGILPNEARFCNA
jgi:hypothetical protein